MDFIAFDVETANADMASICAVGLCRFEAGRPVSDMHFLVDPKDHFDGLNVAIHGITPEMVQGAPAMAEVVPVIAKALAGAVVVHHTHFDRVALGKAAARCGFGSIGCHWLDTARVARRSWPVVAKRGYGLKELAGQFGIGFKHHDAREDARAAGLILMRAAAETGLDLQGWLNRVKLPIDLERAAKERVKLDGNPSGHLAGETMVFTGSLTIPRIDASEMAAQAGCSVHPGVTKETTLLVVGDQDVRRVGPQGKSAKHQKAENMIAAGAAIRIIRETDFRHLVAG